MKMRRGKGRMGRRKGKGRLERERGRGVAARKEKSDLGLGMVVFIPFF